MITFNQYITELFERPYPVREYKRLGSGIATLEITYHAQVDGGKDLMIDITNIGKGWEINFTLDGSYELTHAGNPYRVLATVIAAVKLFLKWHTEAWDALPKQLDMISKTSEGKRDAVYTALMNRFGKEYGYRIANRFTTNRGYRPEDQRTVTTARLAEQKSPPVHGHYALVGVIRGAADIVLSRNSDAIGLEHGKFRNGEYSTIARTPKLPKTLGGAPATVETLSSLVSERYGVGSIRSVRFI